MVEATAALDGKIFAIEHSDDTIIVVPVLDLSELEYHRIEEGAKEILELLNGNGIKNVVVDFHMTNSYGSTALGFFATLWTRVRKHDGCMAFCNVSDHEKELLQLTHLDRLWSICSSRMEALKKVGA